MKRIHQFQLHQVSQLPDTWSEAGAQLMADGAEAPVFSSWHKLLKALKNRSGEEFVDHSWLVLDMKHAEIVACIGATNLQSLQETTSDELPTESLPRWETNRFAQLGEQVIFENRNFSGFHWQLLDGAVHEVPLRLSYLERKAERNPNGMFAYCLGLVGQWRDMFVRRPSHV